MTAIVDECAQQCLLPDGQSTLYDALPPFDEELARDVTVEELSLPPPAEPLDDHQGASGSSLPATPAERPCTFCPTSLPLPPPSCTARATLVLDLDGTLIASEELNAGSSAYLWNTPVGARTPDYEAMGRRVWLRPGVREFLAAVRPHFEVILFTAATQNWAAAAIEQLDPSAELFDVMLHRDHTTSDLVWDYVKDLSRLGRDLARVVIVDDNPLMFMYQPDNALHIGAYEAAMAGGPDNVLPRVAEVLINQVAPAIDVREVLGPMAHAKSCITSTVSAAATVQTAAAPQAQTTEVATATDDIVANAMDCNAACGSVASGDGEGMQCDQWGLGGCSEGEVQSHEATDLQQQAASAQQDAPCSSALSREDESNCTLSDDADKGIDWDGESEGAETFDEHGAAAQLGADVSGSCQRHCSWESSCPTGDACDAVAAEVAAPAATLAMAQESGEQEESDASPHEDHSVHTSEDFEALMDDAMAEYDSDAYEGSYGSGAGYDYASAADTAVAAAVLPETAALSDHGVTDSQFGNVSNCCEYGYPVASSHRHCGRPESCVDVSAAGAVVHGAGSTAAAGVSECNSGVAAVEVDASAATVAATSSVAGSEASLLQCLTVDDAQRQPQLPTGMVFLMDLNPSFGAASCASPDSSQVATGSCDASAALTMAAPVEGDVSRTGELLGCKRVRPEAEADANVQCDGGRGVIARLTCEDTPHSSLTRVVGTDAQA